MGFLDETNHPALEGGSSYVKIQSFLCFQIYYVPIIKKEFVMKLSTGFLHHKIRVEIKSPVDTQIPPAGPTVARARFLSQINSSIRLAI
jgi:hypothetical protein